MERTACRLMMGVGLLALVLSGCSSPPARSEPPTATPMPSGRVDVGGHSLFYTCRGEGSPMVILEAGGGGHEFGFVVQQLVEIGLEIE
jgi:hypothetical protein